MNLKFGTVIEMGSSTFNIFVFSKLEPKLYTKPCNRNWIRIRIRIHHGSVLNRINLHPYFKEVAFFFFFFLSHLDFYKVRPSDEPHEILVSGSLRIHTNGDRMFVLILF